MIFSSLLPWSVTRTTVGDKKDACHVITVAVGNVSMLV